MKLESLIAVRYLFAGRQKSVVSVISWISLIGLLVSTAALIVVLSVYNGIGEITKGLFGTFDPELVVVPAQGKTFHTADLDYEALLRTDGVACVSQVVDEAAWLTYGPSQAIVRLRGVDSNYRHVSGLDTLVTEGRYALLDAETPLLVTGGVIHYDLGLKLHSPHPVAVHIPRRGTTAMGLSMDQAFNTAYAYPTAYFFIQQDIDRQFVVTDIGLVRRLMDYAPDEVSALALKLKPGTDAQRLKKKLNSGLLTTDTGLLVKDRYDQQPLYFKIFRTERLGIYLILSLIVLISTLSLVASLSLLIINKERDVFILRSMGMTRRRLRRAFRSEGILICAVAVAAGLLLGFAVCFLQQHFGIVRMGDGNFVVDAFPVAMRGIDFVLSFLLVMAISTLAVVLTVQRAKI